MHHHPAHGKQQHFQDRPSPPYPVSGTPTNDPFEVPPGKRQKMPTVNTSTATMAHSRKRSTAQYANSLTESPTSTTQAKPAAAPGAQNKSKRVRTGCLTCRERHLKCDEAVPDCLNCRKSNRECKRGVRLNFIDIQVRPLPCVPSTMEWSVQFQDESRQIASEYQGGLSRYATANRNTITPPRETDLEVALRTRKHTHAHSVDTIETTGSGGRGHNRACSEAVATGGGAAIFGYHGARYNHTSVPLDDGHMHSRNNSDTSFAGPPSSSHSTGYGITFLEQFVAIKAESARSHAYKTSDASSAASIVPQVTRPSPGSRHGSGSIPADGIVTPPPSEKATTGEREYINSPEEVRFMQVFVEEVGIWMDSLDKDKHFSRLIPYHSLKSPMLLNAFLACGVKHLTLVDKSYKDDKALFYYDTATTMLLRSLQNPDRNMEECATAAVVLNVYEIMSEKPAQRMSHIAGARALIRECGWDARSTGIGAACFWLNIGMEVLSCLAFNWQTTWDPDHWGLDMDFAASGGPEEGDGMGHEEVWVHRIFYIVAKITNFRATIPRFQEASPHDEQVRLGNRLAQWQELKRLCDNWNNSCPRTMHPLGYLYSSPTSSKSAFPNVWLIKRAAIIGRLFYHTAQCLLAQTNPMEPAKASQEMQALRLHHAHQVCGIVAHTKDRGVASVAIRSLAIASSVLTDPREQEEVLEILDRIHRDSGWRLGGVHAELKKAWGWEKLPARATGLAQPFFSSPSQTPVQSQQQQQRQHTPQRSNSQTHTPTQQHLLPVTMPAVTSAPVPAPALPAAVSTGVAAPAPMKAPVNPLSFADFSLPNHPYQNWYEPPNRTSSLSQPFF